MPKTYVNIPMTEEQARRVAEIDARWTGPKLIVLCAVTLGLVFTMLGLAAWRVIGPKSDEPLPIIQFTSTDEL
jgi:hypothetical protein